MSEGLTEEKPNIMSRERANQNQAAIFDLLTIVIDKQDRILELLEKAETQPDEVETPVQEKKKTGRPKKDKNNVKKQDED